MAKTIEQLKAQSAEVKNATVVGENTATRVGTLFTDIVEHVGEYEAGQTAGTEANAKAILAEKNRAEAAEQAILFDVSAHNNGAVFESLQALLSSSNLSTLIPTSVRHGGITIRFIQGSEQSSDNKYVQARCMAQNFTTDITQWQNMCDVTSVDVPLSHFSFYAGYSYGDSGLETSSSDIACTDMLPIKDAAYIGSRISFINKLLGFSYTLLLNVALFDSNKNFVRRTGYLEQTDFDVQTDNCEYFSFSIRVKDGETIVTLQNLDWVLLGFDLSKIFIKLYNYDTIALQADDENLVKLPLSELGFVNGKSWGNSSLENNSHTIAYLGIFHISDIGRGKVIEIVNENTNGNKLNINIVGFDSNGNIISRTGYNTNWAVFDILKPQTGSFSISLGLLSSDSSDIGGNVIDYGLDKVFIKLRGDSEFLKNLYLKKNSIVYVPLSTYEWKDGISWGNTNIETNSKTIATGLMKTNEYGCNHKLKFINNNRNGYIVRFNIAYFNSSYALVYRTGYSAAGVTEFFLNPNYPYFALSLGLTDGTNDIGGNSLLYDLDNVFIGQKSEVAITRRRDILKMTSLLDFSSEYLFNVENGYGDACCYNDTIFQFVNGNYAVFVYSKTGELLQTIETTRNDKWHNNNVSFGTAKYDSNDDFPLIYASQENADENKCIVYRVTGTQGNYTLTQVQTITFPSQAYSGLNYNNCTIDAKNNLMLISGYIAGIGFNGTEYNGGFLRYMYFKVPEVNSDVTLNYEDAVAITEPFFCSKATQGSFCDNGFLYQTFGLSGEGVLKVLDVEEREFVREINLVDNVYEGEPESAYICDNSIYIGFGDNKVYKIKK